LSFFFKIILFIFFIGLLTLILLLVLDDYFLDFFFVTHDGFQFDIKDRLVDYLQSVNNESTNEVTKNVSDGVGKDVKNNVLEKQFERNIYLVEQLSKMVEYNYDTALAEKAAKGVSAVGVCLIIVYIIITVF
jgi:hypothetical protein